MKTLELVGTITEEKTHYKVDKLIEAYKPLFKKSHTHQLDKRKQSFPLNFWKYTNKQTRTDKKGHTIVQIVYVFKRLRVGVNDLIG